MDDEVLRLNSDISNRSFEFQVKFFKPDFCEKMYCFLLRLCKNIHLWMHSKDIATVAETVGWFKVESDKLLQSESSYRQHKTPLMFDRQPRQPGLTLPCIALHKLSFEVKLHLNVTDLITSSLNTRLNNCGEHTWHFPPPPICQRCAGPSGPPTTTGDILTCGLKLVLNEGT